MSYHFIGLGGIGMSALARVLLQKGEKVRGSDKTASPLLEQLKREGAEVQIGHSAKGMERLTAVIYSTDVGADNVEMIKAKENHVPILHRSDLLAELMKGKKNLLITGTHGKTSTTALLASVLLEAELDPSFVIGGLLKSLNTNGRAGKGAYFVAEADESDGSFLKSPSFGAIVTNLENDHLNYWGSPRMLDLAFEQFFALVKNPEHLFWCGDDPRLRALSPKGSSYGFTDGVDFQISRYRQVENGICFDLSSKNGTHCEIGLTRDIELSLLGRHNALNGAAVFALARSLDISEEIIRRAFKKFSGTARRLDFKGEVQKIALYDDYGHHPVEVSVTLSALRAHVKERRMVVVFQPHRYTRTRDLFEEFISCFQEADELILTDIYSAGEAPIHGVSSYALFTKLREKFGNRVHFFPRSHLESEVAALVRPLDVVLTIGAGDITRAGEPILEKIRERGALLKVGLIFGGASPEHSVSILSAQTICKALDKGVYETTLFGITKEGRWISGPDAFEKIGDEGKGEKITADVLGALCSCDVVIPVLHGPNGEDGMIAAILSALSIPYVGCDHRSGALCMHKTWTKCVAENQKVPTSPFFGLKKGCFELHQILKTIDEKLSYPVWIKPVHLGSSIGVSRAQEAKDVEESVRLAFLHDDEIIIENEVVGRQIEFGVLGNETIRIAPPGEIINEGEFVGYDKKYGASAMEIRVPAQITENEKAIGFELAEKIYRASGCRGIARVDFFIDSKGDFWLNEINPFPGFTSTSAYPKMWEKGGLTMEKLIDEMLALALERARAIKG